MSDVLLCGFTLAVLSVLLGAGVLVVGTVRQAYRMARAIAKETEESE